MRNNTKHSYTLHEIFNFIAFIITIMILTFGITIILTVLINKFCNNTNNIDTPSQSPSQSNGIVQYLTDIKFTEKEFLDRYNSNKPGFNIKYNAKSIIVTGKIFNITREKCWYPYFKYPTYLGVHNIILFKPNENNIIKIVMQDNCVEDFINLKIGDDVSIIGKYYAEINESSNCGCGDLNKPFGDSENDKDYSIRLVNCYVTQLESPTMQINNENLQPIETTKL